MKNGTHDILSNISFIAKECRDSNTFNKIDDRNLHSLCVCKDKCDNSVLMIYVVPTQVSLQKIRFIDLTQTS